MKFKNTKNKEKLSKLMKNLRNARKLMIFVLKYYDIVNQNMDTIKYVIKSVVNKAFNSPLDLNHTKVQLIINKTKENEEEIFKFQNIYETLSESQIFSFVVIIYFNRIFFIKN